MVRKIKFKTIKEQLEKEMYSQEVFPVKDYNYLEENVIKGMINSTFKEGGMVGVKKDISTEVILKIPIIKTAIEFLEILEEEGEVKLTKIGNLPLKIVKRLYKNSLIKNEVIEDGITTLRSEDNVEIIGTAKILCELARYIKKRNGKISLTSLGKKSLKNKNIIVENILDVYIHKFNWSYFNYDPNTYNLDEVFSYVLYLLDSGNKYDSIEFTEELISSFPILLDEVDIEKLNFFNSRDIFNRIITPSMQLAKAFDILYVNGVLKFLGLIDQRTIFSETKFVKSDLFDEIISFENLNLLRKENKKIRKSFNADGLTLYYTKNNLVKFEKELNTEAGNGLKKKVKDNINKEVITMTEKITFMCENCDKEYDYSVDEIILDFEKKKITFKNTPICPYCKTKYKAPILDEKRVKYKTNETLTELILNK